MANPQKENGYTAIANEIMDALISTDLSGQDFKVALLIIRKTYGFNKIEDAVSLTQMMNATGMSKIRCSQVVNRLELMKILTVTQNINGIGKKYKFNKDFENWTTVKENINRYKKTKQTVKVLRNIPLRKTLTTKDNIQKTITKDKALVILPENINPETWSAYLEMRKVIKKPATPTAQKLIIKKLLTIRGDPNKILEQSIQNSWQGVFEIKGDNHANTNQLHAKQGNTNYMAEDAADKINRERAERIARQRNNVSV